MLSLLVISTLALAFEIQIVKADFGTIYINADGSISPSTAPIYTADNITYTLTGNFTSSSDGIVIEKNSIVLDGVGFTVQGNGTGNGIDISNRNKITIENTNIENFECGTFLGLSSNNTISGNKITNNGLGIYLNSSNHIRISGNNITNSLLGIWLDSSPNNSICENHVTENNFQGIWLWSSSSNSVLRNSISNNFQGIWLYTSYSNIMSENNITANNDTGIFIDSSSTNRIYENNIANNEYSITLGSGASNNEVNNRIYHNNFINNQLKVFSYHSMNIWDNGYSSGGNYWSNYNGTDLYHGPYQNVTGSDGIGDTPYVISAGNLDDYPLMSPWIRIVGDLNDDGRVGLDDLVLLANAYDSKVGDPNWNPLADIAPPYGIISLTDLVTMAMHYGQHDP